MLIVEIVLKLETALEVGCASLVSETAHNTKFPSRCCEFGLLGASCLTTSAAAAAAILTHHCGDGMARAQLDAS